MTRVIVIDLVGEDEAAGAERKAASENRNDDFLRAPALGLVEVSFDDPSAAMPAGYRALLHKYFRK